MKLLQIFIYIALIIVTLIFVALNANPVTVQLYWKTVQTPLAWVIACSFIVGMVFAGAVFMMKYGSLLMRFQKMKHHLSILEKEVKNLRTIPIQDSH